MNPIEQAREAVRRGDAATAERICRNEIAKDPGNADAVLLLGTIEAMRGAHDDAAQKFEAVIRIDPTRTGAFFNLGLLRLRQQRNEEALAHLERALDLDPSHHAASAARAHALFATARWPEAVDALEAEVARDERNVEALVKLGIALQAMRDRERALEVFRQAAALRPNDAAIKGMIGSTLGGLGRHREAVDALSAALTRDPKMVDALVNRAQAYRALGEHTRATEDFERAFQAAPTDRRLLSLFMDHLHRSDAAAAEALIERARNLNPLGANVALGNLRADQMRNDEALAAFDAALELEPSDVSARWSRSLVLLRMGNLSEGFEEFEHRAGSFVASASRMLAGPDWNPNSGQLAKRLLLYAEQGLGDTIQFVRLAKVLQQSGHEVALLPPQSLERLCRTLDPNITVLRADRPLSPHDAHCSLMSLPAKLGLDLRSIPASVPYLSVDAETVGHWRARLSALPAPRVGLCWSGSKTHNNDAQRSIPFAQLEPLTRVPSISFVSLVKDVRPNDASALAAKTNVVDVTSDIADFYDTAGLISALDLVVTVDTSIAHLTGALGKPVWILLPFAPDWRWLTDREDSPWYPTARLFRQPSPGAWQPVLERVAAELAALAARY